MEQKNIPPIEKKSITAEKKRVKYVFSRYNVAVWLFCVIKSLFKNGSILKSAGTHIINGYPGSGKSLLGSHIINSVDNEKYFFYCNRKEYNQDNVYTFKIEDMFKDNSQIKSFPVVDGKGRKIYGIIFDEINLSFNKRLNRKSDYNDLFVGLIEFLVSHRHQGIPRVYFIGQKLELQDTQLQSLFQFQHDIFKCKKFPKFKPFNLTGKLVWYPTKLKMWHRIKTNEDVFLDFKKDKIKITEQDYKKYDTQFLGKEYAKLAKLQIAEMWKTGG